MSISVLVTGHCGYIGSALYHCLVRRPDIITVRGYDILEGDDICNYNRLLAVMTEFRPSIVVHLAGLRGISVCRGNFEVARHINAIGTRNVLYAMNTVGCRNIIYSSSAAVYGETLIPRRESSTLIGKSVYGLTKLNGELNIYNHYNVLNNPGSYVILRIFSVIGRVDYQRNYYNPGPVGSLSRALASGYVVMYGTEDGNSCRRDFVHLNDVVDSILSSIMLLNSGLNVRETINVSSGISTSVAEIVNSWNRKVAVELPGLIATCSYQVKQDDEPFMIWGDNGRMQRLLGWKPDSTIDDIIKDTIDKYK
jgi:nucleoside-diphosphate-sugar epimerase